MDSITGNNAKTNGAIWLRRSAGIIGALASLCLVAVSSPVHAASAFASVDLQRVFNGSKAKATADAQMKSMSDAIQVAFQVQQGSLMLSGTELKTLGTLLRKTSPTDADKKTISDMQAKSKKDLDELTELQQKDQKKSPPLDPTETLRFQTLQAQYQAGQSNISDINTAYRDELDQQSQALNAAIAAQIKDAIATVAKAQKIDVVFDAQVALYTSLDITKDVITAVNK